jgi:hypothetical protein
MQATREAAILKRLTLDLPQSLHRRIKREAVEQGVTMAQMLRALLLKHYGVSEEFPNVSPKRQIAPLR